jgi:hypothetical protein
MKEMKTKNCLYKNVRKTKTCQGHTAHPSLMNTWLQTADAHEITQHNKEEFMSNMQHDEHDTAFKNTSINNEEEIGSNMQDDDDEIGSTS